MPAQGSFAFVDRTTSGFSVQFTEMDVNFRHKPRVTTCNFRYTRQCAAIPHRSVYTFPPPSYFPFSLFLPSSIVAVSSFLPLACLPVCLRARRFHSLVVATGVLRATYSSRLLHRRRTEAGFHKSSVQRTRSLTCFYYFLHSLLLFAFRC